MKRWQDPALQAVLAKLSARGLSAAQIAEGIAESIGERVTRDAVASAMKRYGLFAKSRKRRLDAEGEPDGAASSHRR